jgi:hypothetical protein
MIETKKRNKCTFQQNCSPKNALLEIFKIAQVKGILDSISLSCPEASRRPTASSATAPPKATSSSASSDQPPKFSSAYSTSYYFL